MGYARLTGQNGADGECLCLWASFSLAFHGDGDSRVHFAVWDTLFPSVTTIRPICSTGPMSFPRAAKNVPGLEKKKNVGYTMPKRKLYLKLKLNSYKI